MSEPWVHSMHGVPWTAPKMRQAASMLRRRASVGFAFGADGLSDLEKLDKLVFAKRPDLILHIWSTTANGEYSEEFIDTLAGLKHVEALHLSMQKSQNLNKLQALRKLDFLRIGADKSLSLDFVTAFKHLSFLELDGKFKDLSPLAECDQLNSLILKCTIDQLDFANRLPLSYLLINSCIVHCELDAKHFPMLKMLKLSAINKLEDISSLREFKSLQYLGLALSRVKELFDFSGMGELKELELKSMRSLQEVDSLKSAIHLEQLELTDMNPGLKADQFACLATLPQLQQLNIEFMGSSKSRIAAIRKMMIKAGREQVLLDNLSDDKRLQSMDILHLSRILR